MSERDARPDPDALLARLADERAQSKRGHLKVFFGASPGVGKTFAMLAEARRRREQGCDVVVGVVETHGRSETARLATGLPVLAQRTITHRGHDFAEFDLDAALARKPALLLIDELAHNNAPESRHPKRYQDVQELLAAGIDVYTTLNVQHLESLNDIVGGITGVKVRETLPDRVFDQADEVVLVDLPPDDLLQRLKEGKVYVAEQAERAVRHFFRMGNLLALRELALRRTADRVDTQMQRYRREEVGGEVWKTRETLLVGVGPSDGTDTIVRAAARLASALDAKWHAVYVETPALQRLPEKRRAAVLANLKLAMELGAQTATLTGTDIAATLVDYARTHNLGRVQIGRTPRRRLRLPWQPHTADRIAERAPDLELTLVPRQPAAPSPAAADARPGHSFPWLRYAGALATSIAITLLALPLMRVLDPANLVMLFLLGVVVTALRAGRGPAVVAAVANVLAFDFFFVEPRFSFAVHDVQFVVTFIVMLVVGLTVGQLTARLRYQARIAEHRENRARQLFELARELSGALAAQQVAQIGERYVAAATRVKAAVLVLGLDEMLEARAATPDDPVVDPAIARWTLDRSEAAGIGTDTLPAAAALYLPLKAPMRTRGVLVVQPANARLLLIPEQRRLLETFAALIAIALERVHFVTVAQDTLVDMESERLRNSVLAALSHDLRTPLTALVGLSDTLSQALAGTAEAQVASSIREQARRTAQLVDKLLEMARLEAGRVELRLDWQSVEELVGSALHALEAPLAGRTVEVALSPTLPLVHCDGVLIERVLVNLIENAAKYTPADSPIRVTAAPVDDVIEIAVEDRGPGLPAGRDIFGKFTRGDPESVVPGVGLGLAICRAIVSAHGGTIRAEDREGGGARFAFTLPARTPPTLEPESDPESAASAPQLP